MPVGPVLVLSARRASISTNRARRASIVLTVPVGPVIVLILALRALLSYYWPYGPYYPCFPCFPATLLPCFPCFPASLLPCLCARLAVLSPEARSCAGSGAGCGTAYRGVAGYGGGVPQGHAQGACPWGTPPPYHATPLSAVPAPAPLTAQERASGFRAARRVRVGASQAAKRPVSYCIFGHSRPVARTG